MTPFLVSLLFVAIAEMGDKTQLVALAFATRYKARIVLGGVFVATLLVHLFSVAIGETAGAALPRLWVDLASGTAFILFGLWTLRGDALDRESFEEHRLGPFFTVALTFFLAELGDKTMLTTVTIASQHDAFVQVWIGSSLGMIVADALAIGVGRVLGTRLPERPIRYGAAAVFLASGVWVIVSALRA